MRIDGVAVVPTSLRAIERMDGPTVRNGPVPFAHRASLRPAVRPQKRRPPIIAVRHQMAENRMAPEAKRNRESSALAHTAQM